MVSHLVDNEDPVKVCDRRGPGFNLCSRKTDLGWGAVNYGLELPGGYFLRSSRLELG